MISKQKAVTSAIAFTAYSVLLAGVAASHDGNKDLTAFTDLSAQGQEVVSLRDAMKSALAQQPGTVLEAELERDDGTLVYEISIAGKDGTHYDFLINPLDGTQIDAATDFGATIKSQIKEFIGFDITPVEPEGFLQSLASLEGDLLSLEIEEEEGRQLYEVETVSDGQMTYQLLDVQTGNVVFYRHHDDEDGHED